MSSANQTSLPCAGEELCSIGLPVDVRRTSRRGVSKFIVVLGAGESGSGAAILAKEKGFDVFVSDCGTISEPYRALLDQNGIQWEDGKHSFDRIKDADEYIKSPGIPLNAPIIEQLRAYKSSLPCGEGRGGVSKVSIISEIEFASRYTSAKMICITGSNGKTTTTSLIYYILKRAGLNVGLAGNIGNSLALQVARENHDYYVIELSSFQLDNMYDFKADIAILLNITPDHLDRYDYKFQNYIDAKFRITRNQTKEDSFIYWAEDPVIDREMKKIQLGATLYPYGFTQPNPLPVGEDELALKGRHNILNSMAATIAAKVVGIKKEIIRESLMTFQGVEHRLQYVATVRGVRYINDSKATNVNSCWYALESMTTPTVLILGGKDKGNDYSEIDELVKEKCHTLIFMGLHNEKLHEHFGELNKQLLANSQKPIAIIDTDNLHDAVQAAYHTAHEGDTVLLSPCCASFDLFKSYEDRGNQFMSAVRAL